MEINISKKYLIASKKKILDSENQIIFEKYVRLKILEILWRQIRNFKTFRNVLILTWKRCECLNSKFDTIRICINGKNWPSSFLTSSENWRFSKSLFLIFLELPVFWYLKNNHRSVVLIYWHRNIYFMATLKICDMTSWEL